MEYQKHIAAADRDMAAEKEFTRKRVAQMHTDHQSAMKQKDTKIREHEIALRKADDRWERAEDTKKLIKENQGMQAKITLADTVAPLERKNAALEGELKTTEASAGLKTQLRDIQAKHGEISMKVFHESEMKEMKQAMAFKTQLDPIKEQLGATNRRLDVDERVKPIEQEARGLRDAAKRTEDLAGIRKAQGDLGTAQARQQLQMDSDKLDRNVRWKASQDKRKQKWQYEDDLAKQEKDAQKNAFEERRQHQDAITNLKEEKAHAQIDHNAAVDRLERRVDKEGMKLETATVAQKNEMEHKRVHFEAEKEKVKNEATNKLAEQKQDFDTKRLQMAHDERVATDKMQRSMDQYKVKQETTAADLAKSEKYIGELEPLLIRGEKALVGGLSGMMPLLMMMSMSGMGGRSRGDTGQSKQNNQAVASIYGN